MLRFALPCLVVLVSVVATACGPAQSEECRQYVACQKAYDVEAGRQPQDLAPWEPEGDCWVNAENAAQCTEDCATRLDELREAVQDAEIDVPACAAAPAT